MACITLMWYAVLLQNKLTSYICWLPYNKLLKYTAILQRWHSRPKSTLLFPLYLQMHVYHISRHKRINTIQIATLSTPKPHLHAGPRQGEVVRAALLHAATMPPKDRQKLGWEVLAAHKVTWQLHHTRCSLCTPLYRTVLHIFWHLLLY